VTCTGCCWRRSCFETNQPKKGLGFVVGRRPVVLHERTFRCCLWIHRAAIPVGGVVLGGSTRMAAREGA
jgi:hypothetical protein